MTISMNPALVRKAWAHGTAAGTEVDSAVAKVNAAEGSDLGDFQAFMTDAGSDLGGVLDVVAKVIDEIGTSVEACITTCQATDGRREAGFNGLD